MILYLDTSALIKRYLTEPGSEDVKAWIRQSWPASTSLITRAEMGAAITKATRMNWINAEQGQYGLQWFLSEWELFGRLPVNEATVQRADALACQHGLLGFDAVHLACALLYRDGLGERITLATYDRALWQAARSEGLGMLPDSLS
ncbi:MAG: type II toxin-antitoxin system VapC family toxin [Chloroflexi bacterium]|nr:type II toxin-antitoxin system VapC family toxin [Chloroflexota bacterium]